MATLIYAGGVLVGLARIDAPPRVRTALALLWPIGPVAFLVTIAVLIMASLIAFPVFGAAAVVVTGLAWWLIR